MAFDVDVDYRVIGATFAFCALATIAFGLWPALRLSRPDLLSSLKDQAGEVSGKNRRPHHRAWRAGDGADGVVARAAGAQRLVRPRRAAGARRTRDLRSSGSSSRISNPNLAATIRGADARNASRGAGAAALAAGRRAGCRSIGDSIR